MCDLGPFQTDTVVCGDCLDVMRQMPDGCVDLVVTSPPYFNEKEYSHWPTYQSYLQVMDQVVSEWPRILRSGRRVVVNVADIYSKTGFVAPLSADWHNILRKHLLLDSTIVWDKSLKGAGDTAWGSWCLPSNPCIQSYHEYLLVYRREGRREIPSLDQKQKSIMDRAFFLSHVQSIW